MQYEVGSKNPMNNKYINKNDFVDIKITTNFHFTIKYKVVFNHQTKCRETVILNCIVKRKPSTHLMSINFITMLLYYKEIITTELSA